MIFEGGKHELIELAPGWVDANPGAEEFFEVIKDFSKSDLFVVKRLLEQLRHITEHEGPDAALAAIERLCPEQSTPQA